MKVEVFDERASFVKKAIQENAGKMPRKTADNAVTVKELQNRILTDMPAAVKQLDALRAGSRDRASVEISFGEYVTDRWGFSADEKTGKPETLMQALGVNTSRATIDSLMTMPEFESGYKWLVPEIIRDAIRLGMRRDPLYKNLIAAEESVSSPSVTMPYINMSDAMPKKLGETESIPTGAISYGQKMVKVSKVGTGITISDEVQQQVSLNLISLYLQDVGVKMNGALDALAISTAINGDQADGSQAAPVIGVESTTAGFTYYDLLRAWIRMGLIGRTPEGIISNEGPALDILQLKEFQGFAGGNRLTDIKLQTPVPASQNYWIHGAMPDEKFVMLIDTSAALVKLNLNALRVESERIVSRQIEGTYVTVTTGFASLFRDARLIIDNEKAYASNKFPAWMDPAAMQKQTFK